MIALPTGVWNRNVVGDTDDPFDDIVNEGEVSPHFPFVEDIDGATFENGLGKNPHGHIGSSPGAVDGEESEAGGGEPEEVAVRVCHQLVGFLVAA